jgi:hypothetical protein
MRIEVVFPHPEGPTRVVILPLGAVIVSLSTATVPSGYTLETLSNVIMSVFLAEWNSGGDSGRLTGMPPLSRAFGRIRPLGGQ